VNVAGILAADRMVFNMTERSWDGGRRCPLKGRFQHEPLRLENLLAAGRREGGTYRLINFHLGSPPLRGAGAAQLAAAKLGDRRFHLLLRERARTLWRDGRMRLVLERRHGWSAPSPPTALAAMGSGTPSAPMPRLPACGPGRLAGQRCAGGDLPAKRTIRLDYGRVIGASGFRISLSAIPRSRANHDHRAGGTSTPRSRGSKARSSRDRSSNMYSRCGRRQDGGYAA